MSRKLEARYLKHTSTTIDQIWHMQLERPNRGELCDDYYHTTKQMIAVFRLIYIDLHIADLGSGITFGLKPLD